MSDHLDENIRVTRNILESYRDLDDVIPRLKEVYEMAKPYLDLDHKDMIVDLGCRDGFLLEILKSWGYYECYGVELVAEAVERTIAKNHMVYLGNIEKMDFILDAEFDFAFCIHTLEHTKYPDRAVAEIYRILKPAGYVLLEVPVEEPEVVNPPEMHGHFNPFTSPQQLEALFYKFEKIEHTHQTTASHKPWHRWIYRRKP